jgi:flagella basal body P-ring formation protein FlgA
MYHGRKTHLGIALAAFVLLAQGVAHAEGEQFVPSSRPAGTLEMRPEATVFGPEVRLRQVCRWSGADDRLFSGVADLVITRIDAAGGDTATKAIDLTGLRAMLRDAGLNLASVRFAGPVLCTVTRADAGQQQGGSTGIPAATTAPALAATTQAAAPEGPVVSLRERLTRDLADRMQLPVDSLQISFSQSDEKLLNLSEPQFRFEIEPRRARALGSVSWEVTATTAAGTGAAQKAVISATARAWQDQVVANRPISGRQIIRPEDVVEKRTLVESLPDSPLLKRDQIVGQQAAMDMKPGAVFLARLVQATPLARPGQLVTITLQAGAVQIRTVAKAMDEGTFGQTIRVRNEETKEMYEVTLTGPQQGTLGGRING